MLGERVYVVGAARLCYGPDGRTKRVELLTEGLGRVTGTFAPDGLVVELEDGREAIIRRRDFDVARDRVTQIARAAGVR